MKLGFLNNSEDTSDEKNPEVSVFSTISPNQFEFKNFFRDLVSKYEETAGKIQTLLHEPRFKMFYETPIYELTQIERQARLGLNFETTKAGTELDDLISYYYLSLEQQLSSPLPSQRPWPEVEFLFGEDESYQELVYALMRQVTYSINSVTYFSESYNEYCRMVHAIIRLDIDRSIKASGEPPQGYYSSVFSPDDFHYLLTKHNEQLALMKSMVVSKRIGIFDFSAVEFQKTCLPFPKNVIKSIDGFMPKMAVYRNEKLQETMRV